MKINALHILFALLSAVGMLLSACTEDTSFVQSDEDEAGRVILSYSVTGNTLSRAPEPGWNEGWNENEVDRLDLFLFRNQTLIKHYGADIQETKNKTANQNADEELNYHDWSIPASELSPNEIQSGDVVYLIANCSVVMLNGESKNLAEITSLTDLQAASIGTLSCNKKQENFVMTGTTVVGEKVGNDVEIKVDLLRAAAKIRLSFSDASQSDWSDGIAYRLVQYTQSSALLQESDETYLSTVQLSTYPLENADEELVNTSTTETYYATDGQLVLYSYVNNWYQTAEDELVGEIPINEEKQTYIILYAPYGDDGKKYYYKVPVNYQLPEDNDDINPDESYKNLYRLQRNYIYDITVTIDREGGTEYNPKEVDALQVIVVPWTEKSLEVPAFE